MEVIAMIAALCQISVVGNNVYLPQILKEQIKCHAFYAECDALNYKKHKIYGEASFKICMLERQSKYEIEYAKSKKK